MFSQVALVPSSGLSPLLLGAGAAIRNLLEGHASLCPLPAWPSVRAGKAPLTFRPYPSGSGHASFLSQEARSRGPFMQLRPPPSRSTPEGQGLSLLKGRAAPWQRRPLCQTRPRRGGPCCRPPATEHSHLPRQVPLGKTRRAQTRPFPIAPHATPHTPASSPDARSQPAPRLPTGARRAPDGCPPPARRVRRRGDLPLSWRTCRERLPLHLQVAPARSATRGCQGSAPHLDGVGVWEAHPLPGPSLAAAGPPPLPPEHPLTWPCQVGIRAPVRATIAAQSAVLRGAAVRAAPAAAAARGL